LNVAREFGGRGGDGPRGARRRKKKVCQFCVDPRGHVIDYKNVRMLEQFVDDRKRVRKARQTGTCRRHQNRLAGAIKRARDIALLPYVPE
jgi:small subunit ribosomal protein S18